MAPRRPLGRTDLQVHPLCLGGNVFGWSADEETSFAVLDAYVAAGGNFVDTAEVYSGWVPGNEGGESETIIGRWLAARGRPDGLVIATKVGYEGGRYTWGLSRDRLMSSVEGSLARLQVPAIDLYYAHQDDPETPLEETLRAFDDLVRQGVVRHVAASNISAPRLAEALAISDREGLVRYEALQPHYNLLDRGGYEGGLEDLCRREGLGVATYFSLARGFLTGKYRRDQPVPETPRAAGVTRSYFNDRGFAVLDAVEQVAGEVGASPAQVALAWLMARPGVTSAIASATSVEQVRELVGAADVALSDEQFSRLDQAGAGA